jgi:hypothetical protein
MGNQSVQHSGSQCEIHRRRQRSGLPPSDEEALRSPASLGLVGSLLLPLYPLRNWAEHAGTGFLNGIRKLDLCVMAGDAKRLPDFPLSAQSWSDFLIGKAQLVTNEHVDRIPKSLPIFIIGGYSDPVGANAAGLEKLRRLYEGRGLMCVQHRFYGNARHELLTEINREKVTQDIIQWLDTTSR